MFTVLLAGAGADDVGGCVPGLVLEVSGPGGTFDLRGTAEQEAHVTPILIGSTGWVSPWTLGSVSG